MDLTYSEACDCRPPIPSGTKYFGFDSCRGCHRCIPRGRRPKLRDTVASRTEPNYWVKHTERFKERDHMDDVESQA